MIVARLDRFRFDWRQGTAEIWGASVSGGDQRLASVNHLAVSGFKAADFLAPGGFQSPALVRGEGIFARVDREPDGKFAIQRYFPPGKGEPGKVPFAVTLRDVRIIYTDRRGQNKPLIARTSKVSVTGIGNDWRAITTVAMERVGEVSLDLQQLADETLMVNASTPGLAAAPLLEAGFKADLPKELKLAQGRVSGSLRMVRPKTGTLVFRAPITAGGTDVSWVNDDAKSASLTGVVTELGFAGDVTAERGSSRAEFSGAVAFAKELSAGGRVKANLAQLSDLPITVLKLVPTNIKAAGLAYQGAISYAGAKNWQLGGTAKAEQLSASGQTLEWLNLRVAGDAGGILAFSEVPQTWQGVSGKGWGYYGIDSKRLLAALVVPKIKVSDLPEANRPRGLSGNVAGVVIADGLATNPDVQMLVDGNLQYQSPQIRRQDLGHVIVAATYRDKKIAVQRASAMGGIALVTARPIAGGDLEVDIRGLDASRLNPKLSGLASIEGRLRPDFQNPTFRGRVEGYRMAWEKNTIPALVSDIEANKTRALITNFSALRGTTVASGRFTYRYKDGRIDGLADVDNFQISDINDEKLAGTIDIRNIRVSGTAVKPVATFQVVADELVAAGVKVTESFIPGKYSGGDIVIGPGKTSMLSGTVAVNARYGVESGKGAGTIDFSSLSLNELGDWAELGNDTQTVGSLVNLAGGASGKITLGFGDKKLTSAKLVTDLTDLALNKASFGAGSLNAQYDGLTVTGGASLGQIDRYISATDMVYRMKEKTLDGRIEVSHIGVEDIAQLAGHAKDKLSYDERLRFENARGTVSLGAVLSGPVADPDVNLEVLEATGLVFADTKFGNLNANGKRVGDTVTIGALNLEGPVAKVNANGKIVKGGEISVDGEVRDLVISSLKAFAPSVGSLAGKVNLPFTLSGQTDSPDILASLETDGLLQREGDPRNLAMDISLDRVSVSETSGLLGGIDIEGVWKYRGFQGAINATAPFKYPFEVPDTGAVKAQITLAERPLKDVAELSDTLDPNRTEGTIKGNLSATGTRSKLDWVGDIILQASRMGLRDNEFDLKDVLATANIDPAKVGITINAANANGGEIAGDISTKTDAIARVFDKLADGGIQQLLDTELTGNLSLTNFKHRQKFATGQTISGQGNGQITISGPARSPLIVGKLDLSNIDGAVPTVAPAPLATETPIFDPRFNLNVNLITPARLKAATADLSILGTVDVNGKLTAPMVTSELTVEKGSIRLPGGLIRLVQGGDVRFEYNGASNDSPILELNVDGRTTVTTNVTGTAIERYDILISVTGNLLEEGGLSFAATSDPPGLSQDRIIALLGQTDIITGIVGGADRQQTQSQLQNALTGIAVPIVFESLTQGLASSLYLDYLTLDYNPFDRISIVAARDLGYGFSLQGRRQLSNPEPGERVKYDLRLVYRPRRFKGLLSRFSFSVGMDEQRPIKLSLDYSARFGKSYEGQTKGPTNIFKNLPPQK